MNIEDMLDYNVTALRLAVALDTADPDTIILTALKDEYVEIAMAWALLSHNTEFCQPDPGAGNDYMIIEAGMFQQGPQYIVMSDAEGTDKHYVNVYMFNKLVVKPYNARLMQED